MASACLGEAPAFEPGVAEFADRNERDHAAIATAIKSGPVATKTGA
jgi:hypothetical protein